MNRHRTAIGLSLLSMLALVAFGGCKKNETGETEPETTGGPPAATPDPLTGSWSSDTCFGSAKKPADVESCKTTLSFSKELDFSLTAESVNLAAAQEYAGCTTTKTVAGQKWATDHKTNEITISGDGHAMMERTKCVKSTDELKKSPATDISITPGKYKYSIDGKTLNIETGPLRGAFTKE